MTYCIYTILFIFLLLLKYALETYICIRTPYKTSVSRSVITKTNILCLLNTLWIQNYLLVYVYTEISSTPLNKRINYNIWNRCVRVYIVKHVLQNWNFHIYCVYKYMLENLYEEVILGRRKWNTLKLISLIML